VLSVCQRRLRYQHKLLVVDVGSDEHCLMESHLKFYNYSAAQKMHGIIELAFSLPYS